VPNDKHDRTRGVESGNDLDNLKSQKIKMKRLFDVADVVESSEKMMAAMMQQVKPYSLAPKVKKTEAVLACKDKIMPALESGYSAKQIADWWTANGPFPVSAKLITQLFISKPKSPLKITKSRQAVTKSSTDPAPTVPVPTVPTPTNVVPSEAAPLRLPDQQSTHIER
jgi:hypothetical protein